MTSASVIGWLHRAMRHEFGAARQFALQSVVCRGLGDTSLASACDEAAAGELLHAQRLADELVHLGAGLGDGPSMCLPVGRTIAEVIQHAMDTESQAVDLYRQAMRACREAPRALALFAALGAEEAEHLAGLRRLAAK